MTINIPDDDPYFDEDIDLLVFSEYNVYDALEDGLYVSASEGNLAGVTEQYFVLPVYVTQGVMALMETAVEFSESAGSPTTLVNVWERICDKMVRDLVVLPIPFYQTDFQMIIGGMFPTLRGGYQPHSSQDATPCIIVSLPEED